METLHQLHGDNSSHQDITAGACMMARGGGGLGIKTIRQNRRGHFSQHDVRRGKLEPGITRGGGGNGMYILS